MIRVAPNRVLFTAYDSATGRELWETDGTPEGTRIIEIAPGTASPDPDDITVSGSLAFFSADGSVFGEPLDRELWAIPVGGALPSNPSTRPLTARTWK